MARFMYGRNGVDALNWALVILELAVSILSSIIRVQGVSQALYCVSMVLMFIVLIRIFSRNLARRQAENAKFLTWWTPKANAIRGAKARRADKAHKYVRCSCGAYRATSVASWSAVVSGAGAAASAISATSTECSSNPPI